MSDKDRQRQTMRAYTCIHTHADDISWNALQPVTGPALPAIMDVFTTAMLNFATWQSAKV